MTRDQSADGTQLSRRGLLATGLAAGVGTAALGATSAAAGPQPGGPTRARATWPGELGADVFGRLERRSATEITFPASRFDRGDVWQLVAAAGVTGGRRAGVGRDGSPGGAISVPRGSAPAFPRLTQQIASPPAGTTVRLRAWVRTDGVADGLGAYLTFDSRDSRGRRLDFFQSVGTTGTHGWTRLSVVGTIPGGADRLGMHLLVNGTGDAYFDDVTLEELHLADPAHAADVAIAVGNRAEVPGLLGMGVQDNGHAWASYGRMSAGQRAAVDRRLAWLRPSWLRTFVDRSWWERSPGSYGFGGDAILGVAETVEAYTAVGARTNLVMWRPTEWDEDEAGRLADCFVALLEWLSDRGLQIDLLTFINEPDLEYAGSSQTYLAILRGLRQRLDTAGWGAVELVGGDVAASPAFYGAALSDPDATVDQLSFHTYVTHDESLHDPLQRAQDYVDVTREEGDVRPVMVWESNASSRTGRESFSPGTGSDGELTVSRFPSMLTWAAYALQALSIGVQGICYWEAMDSYYLGNRNFLMRFGLWSATDADIRIRHSYYLFGLLSRYILPGADLVRTSTSSQGTLVTAAVRNPDGSRVLYLINPWPDPVTAHLFLPGHELTLRRHRWTHEVARGAVSRQQSELAGERVSLTTERTVSLEIEAESMTVLVSEPAGSTLARTSPVIR